MFRKGTDIYIEKTIIHRSFNPACSCGDISYMYGNWYGQRVAYGSYIMFCWKFNMWLSYSVFAL